MCSFPSQVLIEKSSPFNHDLSQVSYKRPPHQSFCPLAILVNLSDVDDFEILYLSRGTMDKCIIYHSLHLHS